jgi:WD40 repeat protein
MSRIWDCSTSPSGEVVASASGDGTVRIWSPATAECRQVLYGDGGDVYGISWRPDGHVSPASCQRERADEEEQIASAAYDRILRVWDVETAKQIRTFSGHTQSTLSVAYEGAGKLLASGSVVTYPKMVVADR